MSIISVIMPFSIVTQDKSILVKNTGSAYPDTFIVVGINCVATMSYVFFGVVHSWAAPFLFSETMERKEITAVFIGNHDCYYLKEEHIEQAIIVAINKGIRVFLNGGMGHFDAACARVVHRMKARYPKIKSVLVTAYHSPKTPYLDLFDEIIFPFEEQQETYFFYKRAIPERNKVMVEWSSVAISFVYRSGGASRTLDYAKKNNLKIIDLIEDGIN